MTIWWHVFMYWCQVLKTVIVTRDLVVDGVSTWLLTPPTGVTISTSYCCLQLMPVTWQMMGTITAFPPITQLRPNFPTSVASETPLPHRRPGIR